MVFGRCVFGRLACILVWFDLIIFSTLKKARTAVTFSSLHLFKLSGIYLADAFIRHDPVVLSLNSPLEHCDNKYMVVINVFINIGLITIRIYWNTPF